MSLVLVLAYLLASAFGIGALAYALHRFGHSGGALDEAAARAVAAELGARGRPRRAADALLFEAEGGVVVVRAMGRHLVGTRLTSADVRGAKVGEGRLTLRTRAFDAPGVTLRTDEPEALRAWLTERDVLPR